MKKPNNNTMIFRINCKNAVKSFLVFAFLLFICGKSSSSITYNNSWSSLVGPALGQQGPLGYYYDNGSAIIYIPGDAAGQIICPDAPNLVFDIDQLIALGYRLPLVVPAGATLIGDFDMLSTPIPGSLGVTITNTSPNGTLFYSNTYRKQLDIHQSCPTFNYASSLFLFAMEPACTTGVSASPTTIRNIRLRGASMNWTEYNTGYGTGGELLYCGGINIPSYCKFGCTGCASIHGYYYLITHCEISGFSLAGIWVDEKTQNIEISNSYIHHVKGNSHEGIGYGTWTSGEAASTTQIPGNINIHNVIFDDHKDAFDGANALFSWYFHDNSLTQFAGGINKHNSEVCTTLSLSSQCNTGFFFKRAVSNSGCNIAPECSSTVSTFNIHDHSAGNVTILKNIFHKGGISLNYPWGNSLFFNIQLADNTFV